MGYRGEEELSHLVTVIKQVYTHLPTISTTTVSCKGEGGGGGRGRREGEGGGGRGRDMAPSLTEQYIKGCAAMTS